MESIHKMRGRRVRVSNTAMAVGEMVKKEKEGTKEGKEDDDGQADAPETNECMVVVIIIAAAADSSVGVAADMNWNQSSDERLK